MNFYSLYRYVNLLSVDVALGAGICACLTSLVLDSAPNTIVLIVLALVVWAIYTFDHLVDSQLGDVDSMTERHLYHRKHFRVLSKVLIGDLVVVLVLLFFLPYKTIVIGTIIGLLVLIYFLSIHVLDWKKVYHKEIMIGVVYCSGILIAPLSSESVNIVWIDIYKLTPLFFVVMTNLFLFSYRECRLDALSKFPSATQSIGERGTLKFIYLLCTLTGVNIGFLYLFEGELLASVYLVMLLMLLVLLRYETIPAVSRNYRIIGDGVFLVPILYFLA